MVAGVVGEGVLRIPVFRPQLPENHTEGALGVQFPLGSSWIARHTLTFRRCLQLCDPPIVCTIRTQRMEVTRKWKYSESRSCGLCSAFWDLASTSCHRLLDGKSAVAEQSSH